MFTIWVIGMIFTFGFFADEDDEKFTTFFLILVAWPFALGMAAGEVFKKITGEK